MRTAPALLLSLCAVVADAAAPVSFNRDVRPILSDRCYGCHGPDANKGRKAGLRLDELAGATKELKSGERAIIPGDIENSEMVRRMLSTDPDDIMPPPDLNRPLTKAERDVLPAMRAAAPEADVRFELLTRYPGLRSAEDDAVVALALAASGEERTGVISFGSEGGLFAAAGIPAVVCGPGSMDQGHKPDEYVTRDELRRCLRFLQGIAARLAEGWPAA